MNNPELAIPDLDEAIKLDPGFAVAFANRAFAHTLLKDGSKAGQDLDAAVNMGVDRKLLEDKMAEYRERAL
jgi:Tfp pilus assembly protein PilF